MLRSPHVGSSGALQAGVDVMVDLDKGAVDEGQESRARASIAVDQSAIELCRGYEALPVVIQSDAELIADGQSADTLVHCASNPAKPGGFRSLYQHSELLNFCHSIEKID
jgi:hypothetical protein